LPAAAAAALFLSLFLLYLACRCSLLTPFARRVLNLPRLTAPFLRFCGAPSGCALGGAFRGSPRLMRLSSSATCGVGHEPARGSHTVKELVYRTSVQLIEHLRKGCSTW